MTEHRSSLHIWRGRHWIIEDGTNLIKVHRSIWNGLERVYVNDKLVSWKAPMGRGSKHAFEIDGASWEIICVALKRVTSEVECIALKNEHLVFSESLKAYGKNGRLNWLLVPSFVLGLFVGSGGTRLFDSISRLFQ